ncbi:tRNA (guanosine(37)-N1)-methyltransferase TrmD [Dehalobacter sp. DCM]|uniref:tRNA (guanosine(37)-N1)-methyltransferase TrmD n=1 Tax=Dehalobacter sp. DCM TaxID=2907827 RepID=UPI0030816615|nr:tRNA (guanosine(37)-N1)-methyltransferase TrmD [Dehalobacter sp. DCM]
MKVTILTIFPEMFAPLKESILNRAQKAGLLEVELINFRNFAESKHKNVDDVPYGGGAGMVLKPEPIFKAVRSLKGIGRSRRTILLSPQGKIFKQQDAVNLTQFDELVFICGHYEGFDERIRTLADEEISIGDYVLTGGELAAMVIIDSVARLLPGVLGRVDSHENDSHAQVLLEYPQYTRPPEFEGMKVPEVLQSGHHAKIEAWRRKESLKRTFIRRSDLIPQIAFQPGDYELMEELASAHPEIFAYRSRWEHLKPIPRKRRKRTISE